MASASNFTINCSGGAGYRKLRDTEREELKRSLKLAYDTETKISATDIEIKKSR